MRNIYISLIVWFVCNTQIFGNTFVQGENYQFKSIMFLQDTTSENESEFQLETFKEKGSFKSPGKALLYSGVLPGMGQAYMDNWLRGLIFVGLEAAAIGTWYNDNHHNNLVEDKITKYKSYANNNWEFSRWIHDYYKWYEYDNNNPDSEWNQVREAFINRSDAQNEGGAYAGCLEDPTQGKCYLDIWDRGHSIYFYWEGKLINSRDDELFIDIYKELCNKDNMINRDCNNEIEEIQEIIDGKSFFIDKNYHFFEGLQKYDEFFSGWEDNDEVTPETNPNSSLLVTSPKQNKFQQFWDDADKVQKIAGLGGKFMLINRFVSMVDALLLAKKWNNKHGMKLSLNAYPDFRNKSGLGGVKLSLYWK